MPASSIFRQIPSVDSLLKHPEMQTTIQAFGPSRTKSVLQGLLEDIRTQLATGTLKASPEPGQIIMAMAGQMQADDTPSLTRVLNLTGTVLHTNLGRACLPDFAVDAVRRVATGASNLEFDLDRWGRGARDHHTEALIMELTGAEAATLVNNNAAAVILCLNTLALRKKVCISRGELVEIGGSFRIPDIMSRAGSELLEVGSTNRTHLRDYANAMDEDTAVLMKVHTSNYEIRGFTAQVAYAELAELAHEKNLTCLVDLGSGNLVDLTQYGLAHEPRVTEVLQSGVDLVTFSGDKLLGGPQAGIIAGRRELVRQLEKNPLKRALRVDKMTIAALTAVLAAYRSPETLANSLPTFRYLARSLHDLDRLADRLLPVIAGFVAGEARVDKVDCESRVGSGALPLNTLPGKAIRLQPLVRGEAALQRLLSRFRHLETPVIGRLQDGNLVFDLRTLDRAEDLTQLLTPAKDDHRHRRPC